MYLAALALPTFQAAQHWIKVSAEEAQGHLLRKVEPVYPPFAEAAGIEGVVQVNVVIYTDGHIHSLMGSTGPDALFKAAQDAVLKRTYRTFVKDGVPVNASTTIAVSFKLPLGKVRSYPAPMLSNDSFHEDEGEMVSSTAFSPAMKNWLAKDVEADMDRCSATNDASRAEIREKLRKATTIIKLPGKPGSHPIYIAEREYPCVCGGTGNCGINILEEQPRSVTAVVRENGWSYSLRWRKGAAYPDIFVAHNMSAAESEVSGYANLGGTWGQLFCGAIGEKVDIHQCP